MNSITMLLQTDDPRIVWLLVLLLLATMASPIAEVEEAIVLAGWIAPLLRQFFSKIAAVTSTLAGWTETLPALRHGSTRQRTSITDLVCARLC